MPSGARIRGPRHVSCCVAQSVISSPTSWRNKGILVDLAALFSGEEFVPLAFGLQDRLSRPGYGIFIVERDLEGRLGGFVSRCFGVEALEAGIERLSCGAGVQMADGVLLIVCCEGGHSGRYIERVVWQALYGIATMVWACVRPVFTGGC
jgi:hypothetical protein